MDIKFCIDKRTEVMEILLVISDYFKKTPRLNVDFDFEYKREVEEFFAPVKTHNAVKLLNEIEDKLNFNYDAPIALALQLDEDFSYAKLLDYPFKSRLRSEKIILEFLDSIPDFVEKSKFNEFYFAHEIIYSKWIEDTKKNIDPEYIIKFLTEFFKEDFNREYVINLMPLQIRANYGVNNENVSICNLGLKSKLVEGKREIEFASKDDRGGLVQHEFSHPIINPLTDKYFDEMRVLELPNEIREKMRKKAYGSDKTYINEQIIRCMTILYYNKLVGEECEESLIQHEEGLGFIHTRIVLDALKEYEKQDLPLSAYFPRILETFYKPLEVENNSGI